MHGWAAPHVANAKKWLQSELGTAYKDREWRVVVDPEWDEIGKGTTQSDGSDCRTVMLTSAALDVKGALAEKEQCL